MKLKTKHTSPAEFDYDIWKEDDGTYMVRLKDTGEVTPATPEVVRFLWREEKRVSKECALFDENKADDPEYVRKYLFHHPLSLNISPEHMDEDDEAYGEEWYPSGANTENEALFNLMRAEIADQLSPRQLDIFQKCILREMSSYEYERSEGVSHQSVYHSLRLIKEKMKKSFEEGC